MVMLPVWTLAEGYYKKEVPHFMSERERAAQLLNAVPDYKIEYTIMFLQGKQVIICMLTKRASPVLQKNG